MSKKKSTKTAATKHRRVLKKQAKKAPKKKRAKNIRVSAVDYVEEIAAEEQLSARLEALLQRLPVDTKDALLLVKYEPAAMISFIERLIWLEEIRAAANALVDGGFSEAKRGELFVALLDYETLDAG
jgi:hypothetical protein